LPSFNHTFTHAISEKFLRFRKLHSRIIFTFSVLLFLVLLAVLYSINNIISNSANQDIQKNLDNGQQLFKFINDESSLRLTQTASILASDFAFREAIATEDLNTMVSALVNHRIRFNASAMFLVNTDNQLIADTVGLAQSKAKFPFPDLLAIAEEEGTATAIVLLDGHLYQMVVVPVLAPTPIGWLVSGFIIDDKFANNLKSLTGLDVSLLTRQQTNKQWELRATTLRADLSKSLPSAIAGIATNQAKNTVQIHLDNNDYLARISVLATRSDGMVIAAVLQRSLQQALAPLRFLQKTLLILSLLSFAVALLASTWIARGITNPIRKLGALAQRIEEGDYTQTLELGGNDEIGQLASAINHMSIGIADRESKIVELANTDVLTKLPNRTLFLDRLGQAIQIAHRGGPHIAVMVMDLDRFKEVNDILGHHVGDLLLQEVAKRLQTVIARGSDTIARLGGDEFAILLIATDDDGAQIVANKLLKTFDESFLFEGQEIIINTSIGITYHPLHGDDVSALMRGADLAMYAAKRNNSGYVVYNASLAWQTQEHLSLMAELRNAIANGELIIYYQPKLDLGTGKISDVEALIRWIHPVRGLVPPDNFIPFAEHTGFIVIITQWVVENVMRQQQEWRKIGIMLNVSINISARDLLVPKLPAFFATMLKTYDIPPQCLVLEITESSIMANPQTALNIMNELKDMGLSLSVDDFGTGYSSLSYLKKLPVSELKIDRSFVMQMEKDNDDVTIVRSTIDLAHNMGLAVVAEGVENQATCDMLQKMGCDYIQGYFISQPVMAQNLLGFTESYQYKKMHQSI
jgi:diguanylate cyclase (GGDEF)-like protein